jgi:DNA-binding protein H-NS
MIEWEYRKLVLNDVPRKSSDVELLCDAGEEGWELVAILANNIAYLKRPLDDAQILEESRDPASRGQNDNRTGNPPSAPNAYEVKPKYRDPKTNETWSGRGRMATWLKRKQDAGEDIDEYLL